MGLLQEVNYDVMLKAKNQAFRLVNVIINVTLVVRTFFPLTISTATVIYNQFIQKLRLNMQDPTTYEHIKTVQ